MFFGFMGLVPLFSCGNSERLKTMLPLLSCQNLPLNHFLVYYLWNKPYVHKEVSGREGGLGSTAACSALDLSRVAGFKTSLLPSPWCLPWKHESLYSQVQKAFWVPTWFFQGSLCYGQSVLLSELSLRSWELRSGL